MALAVPPPGLPGLAEAARRMLPYLLEEPPCSACGSVMAARGRAQVSGACNACATASVAEPLGFFHECLTCGRRLCTSCNQTEAVRIECSSAERDLRQRATETESRCRAEAAEATDDLARSAEELARAQSECEAAAVEAKESQRAAKSAKEELAEEFRAEKEALSGAIEASAQELREGVAGSELADARARLGVLRPELSVAPRVHLAEEAREEEDEVVSAALLEATCFRALAGEEEQRASEEAAAAAESLAAEENLQAQLLCLREAAARGRARRLCNLAAARGELRAEREQEASETGEAAATPANVAPTALAPAAQGEEGEDMLDRFLGKLEGFVDNLAVGLGDSLIGGDFGGGVAMDAQMAMPFDYLPMVEQMGMPWGDRFADVSTYPMLHTTTASPPDNSTQPAVLRTPESEEAEELRVERVAWERRAAQCTRQLEWMRHDAERSAKEADSLRDEVAELYSQCAASSGSVADLERGLAAERERINEHHRRLRALLLETVASCRERMLAVLRRSACGDVYVPPVPSSLESLFDDSCDWAAPSGSSQHDGTLGHAGATAYPAMADADGDTFVAGLGALGDDLVRLAAEIWEP